ncbi:hypothetical protein FEM48_Zijuj05G0163000 [Ziziphus jujuba var. spinosa]|uniref:Pentatricopeptide repeat-containing protein n=1 Tax=Ziziphus jujuba var. spinosa TaxID=714518 RepID=A0A978VFU5_ZIZJJ|nr:hypothetical protein FEM48_Zijuj05G0163000 [Ziziphus jujuba var. spinosa]
MELGFNLDFVVCTALLDMYAKTVKLNDAVQIFKVAPSRNVVMYNAVISAFLQDEVISSQHANETFNLLSKMQMKGMKPSKFTFASMLKACNVVEAFEYVKQMHGNVLTFYLNWTLSMDIHDCGWVMFTMGNLKAHAPFSELLAAGSKPDEFLISSMLSGCANLAAARSLEQIQARHNMDMQCRFCNIFSQWTIVESLLMKLHSLETACSHGGLVKEGLKYLERLKKGYGMTCSVKHYACIVDLLGFIRTLSLQSAYQNDSQYSDSCVPEMRADASPLASESGYSTIKVLHWKDCLQAESAGLTHLLRELMETLQIRPFKLPEDICTDSDDGVNDEEEIGGETDLQSRDINVGDEDIHELEELLLKQQKELDELKKQHQFAISEIILVSLEKRLQCSWRYSYVGILEKHEHFKFAKSFVLDAAGMINPVDRNAKYDMNIYLS